MRIARRRSSSSEEEEKALQAPVPGKKTCNKILREQTNKQTNVQIKWPRGKNKVCVKASNAIIKIMIQSREDAKIRTTTS
jgi:hypothetical protein